MTNESLSDKAVSTVALVKTLSQEVSALKGDEGASIDSDIIDLESDLGITLDQFRNRARRLRARINKAKEAKP